MVVGKEGSRGRKRGGSESLQGRMQGLTPVRDKEGESGVGWESQMYFNPNRESVRLL